MIQGRSSATGCVTEPSCAPNTLARPSAPACAQAQEGKCEKRKMRRRVVTIDDYADVPPNDEAALMKAVANQPVSVAIEADQVGAGGHPGRGGQAATTSGGSRRLEQAAGAALPSAMQWR